MLSAGFTVSEAFKKHTMHPVKRRHLDIGPTVSYDLRAAIATAKYLFNNVCTDHDLSGAHSQKNTLCSPTQGLTSSAGYIGSSSWASATL